MKKFIISILTLTAGIVLQAEVVTENQAKAYAQQFFATSKTPACIFNSERLSGDTKAGLDAPSYYVFNNPDGGWVIISGEDALTPVLAYSNTGSFKTAGMPSNLTYWLEGLRGKVGQIRSGKAAQSEKVSNQWKTIGERTKAGTTKTISTALWAQEAPYNNLCPTVASEKSRSVTGCVATAMAIVMRHNCYPEKGKGTLPSYTYEYSSSKNVTINGYSIDGKTYNWSNMPLTDGASASWTSAQNTEVAEIMHDCGVMAKMGYSYEGSSAYTSDAVAALKKYMGYSNKAVEIYRSSMSDAKWFEKVKSEIDNNYVLLYGGSGDDGGHQFVCDGYDLDNFKLHINWGWGGQDNGFFTLDMSIPGSYSFDYYQSCVFNLEPDPNGQSGSSQATLFITDYSDYYPTDLPYHGLTLASGTIAKGNTVKFNLGSIENSSDADYSGTVKICLVAFDGSIKQTIGSKSFSLESAYIDQIEGISGQITSDLQPGDCFAVFYSQNDGSFIQMPWDRTDTPVMGEYGVTSAVMIKRSASYKAGDTFYFELTPGQEIISSSSWTVNGTANERGFVVLQAGKTVIKATVTLDSGATKIVQTTITI